VAPSDVMTVPELLIGPAATNHAMLADADS
jgi:hypothetical protein